MTPYEYISALNQIEELASNHAMNYLILLAAFVLVTHFVGSTLNRVQVVFLCTLYSIFLFPPIGGQISAIHRMNVLGNHFYQEHGQIVVELYLLPTSRVLHWAADYVAPIVFATGWVLSLIYMYHVRRAAKTA